MIVLSGAEVVLPDRVLSPGTVVVDDGRIVEIKSSGATAGGASNFAFHGHYIVPGFIDVHVHGVEGVDSLGGDTPIASMARRLPKFGVTAFCPTTVACAPSQLRARAGAGSARTRNPGASFSARAARASRKQFHQPRIQRRAAAHLFAKSAPGSGEIRKRRHRRTAEPGEEFDGAQVLDEIERGAPDIGIVTIAPEIDGGLDLIKWLTARDLRVSLGHSGATFDEAQAAVAAGARHATHLFNRMPPLDHRRPGLVGAILQAEEVAAELICDGTHVHPALVRMAVSAKRPSRIMAITDGTAGAGLPVGTRTTLGEQAITVRESAAFLADGTLAGSVLTMDRAFEMLVTRVGLSPVEAATMCATTPARELGLVGHGAITPGAVADLVVLDAQFAVVQTYVAGRLIYSRGAGPATPVV